MIKPEAVNPGKILNRGFGHRDHARASFRGFWFPALPLISVGRRSPFKALARGVGVTLGLAMAASAGGQTPGGPAQQLDTVNVEADRYNPLPFPVPTQLSFLTRMQF